MGELLPRLTLLSRGYCHLCEDMLAVIDAVRAESVFELEILDVDADEDLERRYGEDVPVLLDHGSEVAKHRLDADVLRRYLAQVKPEI